VASLQSFNDKPQLKVSDMSFISSGDGSAFMPKSKNNPSTMSGDLVKLVENHIKDMWLLKLCHTFFNDTNTWELFQICPAAKTVHHAYLSGLLEHTLSVVRIAAKLYPLYPYVNGQIVVAGALFHDLGKVVELSPDAGFEYTQDGKMLGHILIGYEMVSKYIDKIDGFPPNIREHLLHMIASHHGAIEFGAIQLPKTYEALMLHYADDLDGKLNTMSGIISKEQVEPGGWSTIDRFLNRQIYLANKF
jgi:3'-5' exoribonuclease